MWVPRPGAAWLWTDVDRGRSVTKGHILATGAVDPTSRRRARVALRNVIGMWAVGLGGPTTAELVKAEGIRVSSSAVDRLIKQATDPGHKAWGGRAPREFGAMRCMARTLGKVILPPTKDTESDSETET